MTKNVNIFSKKKKKLLVKYIQEHLKKVMIKLASLQGCKNCSTYMNYKHNLSYKWT